MSQRSQSLHVPALYSGRRVSSRKSVRSASEEDYRYTSIKTLFIDFCNRTSSHGVPFIGSSSFFGKFVWLFIFMCALMLFLIQTYWTMSEYLQYRTIIEMQLRFEAAPFPAATVCNLNAFKYSELIQYSEIKEGFDYWERVINAREMNEMLMRDGEVSPINVRFNAAVYNYLLLVYPVYVQNVNASVCMCFEDVTRGLIWPCYPTTVWTVKNWKQLSRMLGYKIQFNVIY
uniref:Acid-sensing ion channel 1 n=1 Tax=Heterorhabditis bacteriophora TaxID=37862 RepID=A0A1I7XA06_HETBA